MLTHSKTPLEDKKLTKQPKQEIGMVRKIAHGKETLGIRQLKLLQLQNENSKWKSTNLYVRVSLKLPKCTFNNLLTFDKQKSLFANSWNIQESEMFKSKTKW